MEALKVFLSNSSEDDSSEEHFENTPFGVL
jgi:hypothetical protein